ncbi:MAG: septum formation initiator family protein [Chlamydiales bacterium]|nr:septum formation initiator family protein [Chlamydiales bacterium]
MGIFIRVCLCILTMGLFLYAFISKQNDITELRLQIPIASRELQAIQQENVRLKFEIDRFENPAYLMELARRPQFSHLKHPLMNEIITIYVPEGR